MRNVPPRGTFRLGARTLEGTRVHSRLTRRTKQGFGVDGSVASWLPQPHTWPDYARDAQRGIPGSTLEFYKAALVERRTHGLASNELAWLTQPEPDVLAFRSGALTVIANTGTASVALPAGRVVLSSGPVGADVLPGDTTVWLIAD